MYDIRESELEFAIGSSPDGGVQDDGSIKHLQRQQQQLSILRRYSLCCLLSLPAASSQRDLPKWRMVTQAIQALADTLDGLNRRLCDTLHEVEGKLCSYHGLSISPTVMVLMMPNRRCTRGAITKDSVFVDE